jgi:hypothetical protein
MILRPAYPSADDVLVFRKMVGDGFPCSVQHVPEGGNPAPARSVMCAYYPRIVQCTVSTLTSEGASAGFAAAGL